MVGLDRHHLAHSELLSLVIHAYSPLLKIDRQNFDGEVEDCFLISNPLISFYFHTAVKNCTAQRAPTAFAVFARFTPSYEQSCPQELWVTEIKSCVPPRSLCSELKTPQLQEFPPWPTEKFRKIR